MNQTKVICLKNELDIAEKINESRLAEEVKAAGFKCKKCAQCCREEYGDNTVAVFPFEIRRICEISGLEKKDIVVPAPSQDVDPEGNFHTFGWVLRKKGDCNFLKNGLCEIYECRPYICKTYPFYLLDGKLNVSECAGTGSYISSTESKDMAALLKERYIAEIREAIALFEKFRGFKPDGSGNICVHDCEGEHWSTH